jgi:hypothetical protein
MATSMRGKRITFQSPTEYYLHLIPSTIIFRHFSIPDIIYKFSYRTIFTLVFMFSTVFPTTMAGRPSFNRTRNSTGSGPVGNRNRSNDSSFESDRNNNSQPNIINTIDESPEVILYLLSSLVVPSVICFLFLFYNFIRLPQLRTKATNLLIICLLINNFIHVRLISPYFSILTFVMKTSWIFLSNFK